MHYRFASTQDAEQLAQMNLRLIADEGHRNSMDIHQLAARMTGWLRDEYQAVLFEEGRSTVGYALFRLEPEYVYLRQLFVAPERRRQGIASSALSWLWENVWQPASRLRIDVLVGNAEGQAFWRSAGFTEYCITMEASAPTAR